jgi:hypothetical protein
MCLEEFTAAATTHMLNGTVPDAGGAAAACCILARFSSSPGVMFFIFSGEAKKQ